MSTVSRAPSRVAASDQAADRKTITDAGEKAHAKLATVDAQADVAISAAKLTLGLQENKDYVVARASTVGGSLASGLRCTAAKAIHASMVKMEPAETIESPLIEGAKQTVATADKTLAAFAGARAALEKKASEIPVNLDCTPPKAEKPKTEQK